MADDALQRMLDAQVRLQARMPAFAYNDEDEVVDGLTGKTVSRRSLQLKESALMAAKEALEVLDEVPWKMHKLDFGRPLTDDEVARARVELIDELHYVLTGLLLVDVTSSEEIEEMYFQKNRVNHDRRDVVDRAQRG